VPRYQTSAANQRIPGYIKGRSSPLTQGIWVYRLSVRCAQRPSTPGVLSRIKRLPPAMVSKKQSTQGYPIGKQFPCHYTPPLPLSRYDTPPNLKKYDIYDVKAYKERLRGWSWFSSCCGWLDFGFLDLGWFFNRGSGSFGRCG